MERGVTRSRPFLSLFFRVVPAVPAGQLYPVAIKMLDLDKSEDWDSISKEVSLMSQIRHENCVNFITSFVVGQKLWIVMPLLAGGSVRSCMQVLAKDGFANETVIATILKGALEGLAYMHDKRDIIHRDVKAGNILLSSTGVPKLADFGVASPSAAVLMKPGKRKVHTFTGTHGLSLAVAASSSLALHSLSRTRTFPRLRTFFLLLLVLLFLFLFFLTKTIS